MKKALNLRVVVATTVFMMLSGLFSVNAQLVYKDSNHLFLGQLLLEAIKDLQTSVLGSRRIINP
jgi:hypothetical protein